jgi:hypothetical protein
MRLAMSCASSFAVVVSLVPWLLSEERAVMGFFSRIEAMRRTTSGQEMVCISAYNPANVSLRDVYTSWWLTSGILRRCV